MKKTLTPGLILIVAGLFFLVDALPGVTLPGGAFVALVGLALLIARLFNHRYGLTIAGFVVLCLGLGWTLLDVFRIPTAYTMAVTPLSLALAFFLIHICEFRRIGNWPIIPALILLCFGVMFYLMLTPEVNALLRPYYGVILPALLIVLGIYLLVRGLRASRRPRPAAAQGPAPASDPGDPSTWAQPPVSHAESKAPEQPVVEVVDVSEAPEEEPETQRKNGEDIQ